LRIVNTLAFTVATYGCETWTIKEGERKKIAAFGMWGWSRMLRIPWTARRTNTSIWKQLDVEPMLEYKIRSQRVSYFGHVARRQSLERTVMLGMGGGGRQRGRGVHDQDTKILDDL